MKLLTALICYPLFFQWLQLAPGSCSLSPMTCVKVQASSSVGLSLESPAGHLFSGKKTGAEGPMSSIFRW